MQNKHDINVRCVDLEDLALEASGLDIRLLRISFFSRQDMMQLVSKRDWIEFLRSCLGLFS
jgi:hypothetical protein